MGFDAGQYQELSTVVNFLNRYKTLIVSLLVFFLVALTGSHFWYNNRLRTNANASQIFQEMVFAELQQDADTARAKGTQLIEEYANSTYAQFAGLLLAKIDVAENNLDSAVQHLQWVAANKRPKQITQHLATVRLAAVLQQQGKLDEALELVAKDPDPAFVSLYAQARGDLYVAKNEIEEAKKAYKLAMQSLPGGTQSPLLQMKMLDLGVNDAP